MPFLWGSWGLEFDTAMDNTGRRGATRHLPKPNIVTKMWDLEFVFRETVEMMNVLELSAR